MASVRLLSEGSGLELSLAWTAADPVSLTLRPPVEPSSRGASLPPPTQSLVEALAVGHGRSWAGRRYVQTEIGARLRYREHRVTRRGPWQTLWLTQDDELTGLEFTSELSIHDDLLGLRSATHVRNAGPDPVTLQAVTSLVFSDFALEGSDAVDAMTLLRGRSDWLAEGQWVETGLRAAGLPRLRYEGRPFRTRGCVEACSVSSWSTAYELPTAVLSDARTGLRWSFQVEHNGGWLWQVGELPDGVYVALLGPTDEHHQWHLELAPDERFSTVPASLTVEVASGPPSLGALTEFRRASRPAAPARERLVVFNDYMNTVYGDPSAEVLHPLIDVAAEAGVDVFVIDAGWYADNGGWWDTVGEWQPSTRRFPAGFGAVLEHIHRRGMRPGLWLEPEVVGVNSPMALKLPDEAFLTRGGIRVRDHGRFHLDFSSEATTAYLTEVVDRLIDDYGVGYFKFDYNIRAGVGSDARTPSTGHGLLLHNRAYLAWVDAIRARHPGLVLENCASGGLRADFGTVSRFDLQSTSDQEDLHAYAPVAAAAPMLILPEQAGNWAYPQPGMSEQELIFTLATAMLGRLYLSGWLSRMSDAERSLVIQAVVAHKQLLDRTAHATPFWPLGLPGWDDDWIALGLRDPDTGEAGELYVTIWRRSAWPGSTMLPLPEPPDGHRWSDPIAIFPDRSPLTVTLDDHGSGLVAEDETGLRAARVVRLSARRD